MQEEIQKQQIEFCCVSIFSLEELDDWLKQFEWYDRVQIFWDTFSEQVIIPKPDYQLWTQEEYAKILSDLTDHWDVSYAQDAKSEDYNFLEKIELP